MTTISQELASWATAVLGRWIDTGQPNVNAYGRPTTPECIDLTRHWAMQLGAEEKAYGHALDFSRNLAREPDWDSIPVGSRLRTGDVVSVLDEDRWPRPYGHVFVVQDVGEGDRVQVIEQNPTPARSRWTTVPRSAIVGIARPEAPVAPTVTIKTGDTFWSIARRLSPGAVPGMVASLLALNPGLHPMNLPVGGEMKVPA